MEQQKTVLSLKMSITRSEFVVSLIIPDSVVCHN